MPTNAEYLKQRRVELKNKISHTKEKAREQHLISQAVLDCLQGELDAIERQMESRQGIKTKSQNKKEKV